MPRAQRQITSGVLQIAICILLLQICFLLASEESESLDERIDCSPLPNVGPNECAARGCIWAENHDDVKFLSANRNFGDRVNLENSWINLIRL